MEDGQHFEPKSDAEELLQIIEAMDNCAQDLSSGPWWHPCPDQNTWPASHLHEQEGWSEGLCLRCHVHYSHKHLTHFPCSNLTRSQRTSVGPQQSTKADVSIHLRVSRRQDWQSVLSCLCFWSTTARALRSSCTVWRQETSVLLTNAHISHHAPSPQVEGRHGSMVLKTCVGIQKSPDSRVVAVHCHLCTADGFPHLDPRLVTSSI